MQRSFFRRVLPLLAGLGMPFSLAVACGNSDTNPPSKDASLPACVPGQQVNCMCPGGIVGVQVCSQGGNEYGACACGDGAMDAADASRVDATLDSGQTTDSGKDAILDSGPTTSDSG